MTPIYLYLGLLLAQLTVISGTCILGMLLWRNQPACRHAVGLIGLISILLGPLIIPVLPTTFGETLVGLISSSDAVTPGITSSATAGVGTVSSPDRPSVDGRHDQLTLSGDAESKHWYQTATANARSSWESWVFGTVEKGISPIRSSLFGCGRLRLQKVDSS